jgi:hypothetical protein
MARIEDHPDAALSDAVGKTPALGELPWYRSERDGRRVEDLKAKARARLAGTGNLSNAEIQDAIARLILG